MVFKRITDCLYFMAHGETKLEARVAELEMALSKIVTWADELGYYADEGTQLAPVLQLGKEVLYSE